VLSQIRDHAVASSSGGLKYYLGAPPESGRLAALMSNRGGKSQARVGIFYTVESTSSLLINSSMLY
jgi:hypothetical protein